MLGAMADAGHDLSRHGRADERRTKDVAGRARASAPGPGCDGGEPAPEWVDLAGNVAGVGVVHEAARRRQRGGVEAGRSWDRGAKGEYEAGRVLARLTAVSWWDRVRGRAPRWRVLHSVDLRDTDGAKRGDIDHVVLGPPGLVTINTKHHRRGNIVVDGDTLTVNGRRTAYVAKARQEADRARGLLVAALTAHGQAELAARLPARPLILVVGAMPRIAREAEGVPVVPLQRLRHTVEGFRPQLAPDEVATVYEMARRDITWATPGS
jgi:hypothetical protein